MKRLLIGAAFVLYSTVIGAIGAEFLVRLHYRDVTTGSTAEGYFNRRWKRDHLRRNPWGFRDRGVEFSEGDYRIAVIGDSFAFGPGIEEEQRFSNLMGTLLSEDFDVLQFANPGAETDKHLETLTNVVLKAEPDFVLLQWLINDVEIAKPFGRPKPRPLFPRGAIEAWLRRSSALYDVVNGRWRALQIRRGWILDYTEFMRERYGDPEGRGSRTAMKYLDEFISTCERANVAVGIVLFPMLTQDLAHDYGFDFLHDRVLALCEARGIPCLDLRSTYAAYSDRMDEIWVSALDHHPGPLGHRLAAERIVDFFDFRGRSRGAASAR